MTFKSASLDLVLYLGLFCWIGIIATIHIDSNCSGWACYGKFISTLIVSQLPVLVLVWKKADWKRQWSPKRYRVYWIACFGVYLPLLAIGSSLMFDGVSEVWEVVVSGAVCSLFLEGILIVNAFYANRLRQVSWIQKLSLEKAVLISISFIAIALASMAVSSLDNPLYHTKEQLLIGFEFSPARILMHLDTFLSYSAQLLFMYLCGYFFFLVNSRLLVAKILKDRGAVMYILSSLALVSVFYPLIGQLLIMLPINDDLGGIFSQQPLIGENAIAAIIILLISLPVLLAVQWSKQNAMIVALEKEKAQTELDLLKQQLNPHFFFNTLNNLYALSLQKSTETPNVILQLSELMRYVIYKAKEPQVKIADEVQYLHDYLDLQSIRLKEKFDLRFETEIGNDSFLIAPLLLIVFIENAFKHGIETAGGSSFLHISLKTEGQKLHFTCENSFEQEPENITGIGLNNLKKRLDLLYPGRYKLQIKKENLIFKAELELETDGYAMPDR